MATTSNITDLTIQVKVDDKTAQGAAAAQASLEKVQKTAQGVIDANNAIGDSANRITQSASSFDRFANRYDAVTKAAKALSNAQQELTNAQAAYTREQVAGNADADKYQAVVTGIMEKIVKLSTTLGQARADFAATSEAHAQWMGVATEGTASIKDFSQAVAQAAQTNAQAAAQAKAAAEAQAQLNSTMQQARSAFDFLDQARAKYVPLFAAQQQYEKELSTISDLEKAQALTTQEGNDARAQAEATYARATNAAKEWAASLGGINSAAAQGRSAFDYLDSARAKYDDLYRVSKQYEESLNEILDLQKAGAFGSGASSDTITQNLIDAQTASFQRQVKALQDVAAATEEAAREQERLFGTGAQAKNAFNFLDDLKAKYLPLTAAQQQYEKSLADIDVLEKSGAATAQELATARKQAQQTYDQTVVSIQKQQAALSALNSTGVQYVATAKQQEFAVRQFGVSTIQFFSSVQGGQSIITALVQQGHQMLDVAVVTGTGFGTMAQSIKRAYDFIGGFPTIVGAAVVASLVAMTVAAEHHQERLVQLQNTLRATRTDYTDLATAVDKFTSDYARLNNLPQVDVQKAATSLASSPFVSTTASLQKLLDLSRDLATVQGTQFADEAQKMTSALNNLGDAAKQKAAAGYTEFNAQVVYSIERMEAAGDKAGALAAYEDALARNIGNARNNMTPFQQAIDNLGKAFENLTSKESAIGGFFKTIGDSIMSLATGAIDIIAKLVNKTVDAANELRKIVTTPSTAPTGAPGSQSAGEFSTEGRVLTSDQQHFGLMQVSRDLGRSFNANIMTPEGNVYTGLSYLDQLAQLQFNGRAPTLDEIIGQYRKGPSGYAANPAAASSYISAVNAADISTLPKAVSDLIDAIAKAKFPELSEQIIETAKKITVVESQGRQFVGAVENNTLPIPPIPPTTPVSDADRAQLNSSVSAAKTADTLQTQIDANRDLIARIERDIQTAQTLANNAAITGDSKALTEQIQNIDDLSKRLKAAKDAQVDLTTEQNKAVREAQLQTQALQAQSPVARQLLQIQVQQQELARQKGQDYDPVATANLQSEAMKKLTTEFNDHIVVLDQDTKLQEGVNEAIAKGGDAADHAANEAKAYADVYSNYAIPGTKDFTDKLNTETAALDRNTEKKKDAAAANDVRQFQLANETLQKQIDLLGSSADAQAQEVAELKERHKWNKTGNDDLTAMQQNAVDNARANASLAHSYDLARNSLANFGSLISSSFNNVFQALTDAFVSGQQHAINWGNILRGVAAQVMNAFLQLAVLNPILNSLGTSTTALPTLGSTIGALSGNAGGAGGSGGGGSLLGTGSSILSIGSGLGKIFNFDLGESLGLTGQGGLLTGLGNQLGLTGSGGLFGGLGALMDMPVLGGLSVTTPGLTAADFALEPMAAAQAANAGVNAGASSTATLGGTSLGELLGGVGLGFSAGSLGGGLLQNALNKTGPAPMIGAGLGSVAGAVAGSFIPGIGTLIGGLIGGLLGGGGGGLIGPHPANPFATAQIDVNPDGTLRLGSVTSQKEDVSSLIQDTNRQIGDLNNILTGNGIKIANPYTQPNNQFDDAGLLYRIGNDTGSSSTLGNIGQNFADIFPLLRFDLSQSSHPELQPIFDNRGYVNAPFSGFSDSAQLGTTLSSLAAMSDAVKNVGKAADDGTPLLQHFITILTNTATDQLAAKAQQIAVFVGQTVPTLEKFGKQTGALNDTFDQINQAFLPAIDTAKQLGYAEQELTQLRQDAIQKAVDAIHYQYDQIDRGFQSRINTANATANPNYTLFQQEQDALYAFETQAMQQRHDLDAQIVATFGDAVRGTENYNAQIAQLENALGAERLAIVRSYEQQIAAAQKAIAQGDQQETARYLTAYAQVNQNNPSFGKSAALYSFDIQAQQQRDALDQQLAAIYGPSIRQTAGYAAEMALLEKTLGEERLAIAKQYDDQISAAMAQLTQTDINLNYRYMVATAGDNLGAQKNAALYNFDAQADLQRQQFSNQLIAIYGAAVTTTEGYAAQMALLERTLGAERLAVAKQYDDQIAAQQKAAADQQAQLWNQAAQSATQAIQSLTDYAKSLEVSDLSPLSATDQYGLAKQQFEADLFKARQGDATALTGLQSYAQAYLQSSRTVYGSGTQYVQDFTAVVDALQSIAGIKPDTLTASFFALQQQQSTTSIVSAINALKAEVTALRNQIGNVAPSRIT